jgi:hypothetical protein
MLWPKPAPGNEESLRDISKHWLVRMAREEQQQEDESAEQKTGTPTNPHVGSDTTSLSHETETNSDALGSEKTAPKAKRGKGYILSSAKVGSSVKVVPI